MRIATPFSTLFHERQDMDAILALSDAVEIRQPGQQMAVDLPLLYHSELSVAARWSDREKQDFSRLAAETDFELISFHLLSRYQENICVNGAFRGQGVPYSRDELFRNVRENVEFVRGVILHDLPVLIENNNDLASDAYQTVTDAEFINCIILESNLFLLWDVSHSIISAFNNDISLESYLAKLPLDRCLQVHLSRHAVRGRLAYDAHEAITEEDWHFFEQCLSQLPLLRYVTIEYYMDTQKLMNQLTILRKILTTYRESNRERFN